MTSKVGCKLQTRALGRVVSFIICSAIVATAKAVQRTVSLRNAMINSAFTGTDWSGFSLSFPFRCHSYLTTLPATMLALAYHGRQLCEVQQKPNGKSVPLERVEDFVWMENFDVAIHFCLSFVVEAILYKASFESAHSTFRCVSARQIFFMASRQRRALHQDWT